MRKYVYFSAEYCKKTPIIWRYALNKSCIELNFLQKNLVDAYLYLPGVELEGSKDLLFLKYYNGRKWECRFTLTLNTAKNIDYIEKCFKQKLSIIKFIAKNKWTLISIFLRSGATGLQKFAVFYIIIMHWNGRETFTSLQRPHRVIL